MTSAVTAGPPVHRRAPSFCLGYLPSFWTFAFPSLFICLICGSWFVEPVVWVVVAGQARKREREGPGGARQGAVGARGGSRRDRGRSCSDQETRPAEETRWDKQNEKLKAALRRAVGD